MTGFTYVELFAGLGGVSFGFNQSGGRCVMAAEVSPAAVRSFTTLHPDVDLRGDVTKIAAEDVPDHDVLSFTPPCQSFSVAGLRKGFEDTRGTLTFEALRIAKIKRPKALFMENVKGLVNHDGGNTLDTVIHAMNDIGYTVDFNVLNSKYFDAAQNRERVFVIAVREDLITPEPWIIEGNTTLQKAKRRLLEQDVRSFNFDWPVQDQIRKSLVDIIEQSVDDSYFIDGHVTVGEEVIAGEPKIIVHKVPQTVKVRKHPVDTESLRGLLRHHKSSVSTTNRKLSEMLSRPITEVEHWFRTDKCFSIPDPSVWHELKDALNIETDTFDAPVTEFVERVGVFEKSERCYDVRGLAPTLTRTSAKEKIVLLDGRVRYLTPAEALRLQTFPEDVYTKLINAGISAKEIYEMSGNAVTVNVIQAIGERIVTLLNGK